MSSVTWDRSWESERLFYEFTPITAGSVLEEYDIDDGTVAYHKPKNQYTVNTEHQSDMENRHNLDEPDYGLLCRHIARLCIGSFILFFVAMKFLSISAFGSQIILLALAAYLYILASFKFIKLMDCCVDECQQCCYSLPWIILFIWTLLYYSITLIPTETSFNEQVLLVIYVKLFLLFTFIAIVVKGIKIFSRRNGERIIANLSLIAIVTMTLLFWSWYNRIKVEALTGLFDKTVQNDASSCVIPSVIPWVFLISKLLVNPSEGATCPVFKAGKFCHMVAGMVTIDAGCHSEKRIVVFNNDFMEDGHYAQLQNLSRYREKIPPKKNNDCSGGGAVPIVKDLKHMSCYCGSEEDLFIFHSPPKSVHSPLQTSNTGVPNILLVTLDTVSRTQFIRRMPKMVDLLETLPQYGYSVFQFFKYNAVDLTHKGNIIPLLSGHKWTNLHIRNRGLGQMFPWTIYREKFGFETAWLSNGCRDIYGEAFNEPYNLDHDVVLPFCERKFDKADENDHADINRKLQCVGRRFVHEHMFDYLLEMTNKNPKNGKFLMVNLQEKRENDSPDLETVSTIDSSLRKFSETLLNVSHMKNTITVLTSDYGYDNGPYSNTEFGSLEQKLPVLFLIIPNDYLAKFPKMHRNLIGNEQKLITAYDLHLTLHHFAHYPANPKRKINSAYSLLDSVPFYRTCSQARIKQESCSCE